MLTNDASPLVAVTLAPVTPAAPATRSANAWPAAGPPPCTRATIGEVPPPGNPTAIRSATARLGVPAGSTRSSNPPKLTRRNGVAKPSRITATTTT